MKKRLYAMISAVLALSLLAGCGSARVDSEPDPVEGVLPGEELGAKVAFPMTTTSIIPKF